MKLENGQVGFAFMIRSPRSVSFILTDGVRRLWAAQCFKCISKLLEFQVSRLQILRMDPHGLPHTDLGHFRIGTTGG